MAWTAPTTRSTGDLITAAIWNTDLVDNIAYLGVTHDHFTLVGAGGGAQIGAQRLGQTEVTVATGSVSVASINQTYDTLVIAALLKPATDNVIPYMTFNGDTGANYEYDRNGAVSTGQNQFVLLANNMGNDANKGFCVVYFVPQYVDTVLHKAVTCTTVLSTDLAGAPAVETWGGRWTSTAAVNRVDLSFSAGNVDAGSVLTIYGLK